MPQSGPSPTIPYLPAPNHYYKSTARIDLSLRTETIALPGAELELHPYRAAYWPERETLLIADVHLGKVQHFRREGIPLPQDVSNTNWDKLIALLLDYRPRRVIFLGDLFHSDYNAEWEEFCDLMARFEAISFELIKGNHDRLSTAAYQRAQLIVHPAELRIGDLLLSHHPREEHDSAYNLAGHIHPAVRLSGGGRQRIKLPCFFFGPHTGILPAFGAFTGTQVLTPTERDRVYVLTDEAVLPTG